MYKNLYFNILRYILYEYFNMRITHLLGCAYFSK